MKRPHIAGVYPVTVCGLGSVFLAVTDIIWFFVTPVFTLWGASGSEKSDKLLVDGL